MSLPRDKDGDALVTAVYFNFRVSHALNWSATRAVCGRSVRNLPMLTKHDVKASSIVCRRCRKALGVAP
jgi:hypothetical protein